MICSILIPTRGRKAKLRACLESFYRSGNIGEFEVLLAIDTDDAETQQAAEVLKKDFPNVEFFVGDRGSGWYEHGRRYSELAAKAKGEWTWMMNDDSQVRGANWTEAFRKIEGTCLVHPEFHRLNESLYQNDPRGSFPAVRNKSWEILGYDAIGTPTDDSLNNMAENAGWPVRFLQGVEMFHDREVDDTLPTSRK